MIALAPEYGVGLAVMEYLDARRDLKEVKERWPDLEVVLVHAFYARMGGFALEITEAPEAAEVPTNYPDALGAPPVPEAGWDEAFESVVMTGVGPSNGSPNHHPVPRDLL